MQRENFIVYSPPTAYRRVDGVFRVEWNPVETLDIDIGRGVVLVCQRRGVKLWDGGVLRRWVEVTQVGFKFEGGDVQWYHSGQ